MTALTINVVYIYQMEIQSRRLHDAAQRGAIDVCKDARNAGGAVTFVPQGAPVSGGALEDLTVCRETKLPYDSERFLLFSWTLILRHNDIFIYYLR